MESTVILLPFRLFMVSNWAFAGSTVGGLQFKYTFYILSRCPCFALKLKLSLTLGACINILKVCKAAVYYFYLLDYITLREISKCSDRGKMKTDFGPYIQFIVGIIPVDEMKQELKVDFRHIL